MWYILEGERLTDADILISDASKASEWLESSEERCAYPIYSACDS